LPVQFFPLCHASSDRFITAAQASRISQAVKAVAIALGKVSGRNEFDGVYGELYRRFEVTSYFVEGGTAVCKHGWAERWYRRLAVLRLRWLDFVTRPL
jgi:hypothetical protein